MTDLDIAKLGGARISYLDIAKGIGIILIVMGHVMPFCFPYYWMFGFHVPLFFLISGLVNDFSKYDISTFMKKKIKSLFIPFLIWYSLQIVIANSLFDGGLYSFRAVWFIEVLFFAEIIYFLMSRLLEKYLFYIPFFLLAIVFVLKFIEFHSFYKLESIPAAIFYISIGCCLRNWVFRTLNYVASNNNIAIPILFLLLGLSLIRAFLGHRTEFPSNSFVFSDYVLSFSGIGFVLLLSKLINENRVLQYLGRNTIIIVGLHIILIYITVYCVEPLFENHIVFKVTQQVILWGCSIIAIWFCNNYFPWAAGKAWNKK